MDAKRKENKKKQSSQVLTLFAISIPYNIFKQFKIQIKQQKGFVLPLWLNFRKEWDKRE